MRSLLLILLVLTITTLFPSCDGYNDPLPASCDFSEEPFLTFYCVFSDYYIISYQNADGLGDSIFCSRYGYTKMPIDPNSNKMYFQVKSTKGTDSLSVSYTIRVIEEGPGPQKLRLENIIGNSDSSQFQKHIWTIPYTSKLDSLGNPQFNVWRIDECSPVIQVR